MNAISHVSLGTNDFARAKAFYDAVLATLDIRCVMDWPGGAGYGKKFPEFWIQAPHDGKPASVGNGTHVCFNAAYEAQVEAFYAKALEMGGRDDGAPGVRKEYSESYFAAFVRDLDGNKVEAVCWLKK